MKNFIKLFSMFLFVVLVGALVGCKTTNALPPTKTEITSTVTKEVVRDTIFETKEDSSYYNAWLECQNGKVVIKDTNGFEPIAKKGNYLKPPIVTLKDNVLKVDCEAEAQKLFAQWKDVYTIDNKQTTITNTIEVERNLSFWEQSQIWCGRIFLAFAIYKAAKFLIKNYKIV